MPRLGMAKRATLGSSSLHHKPTMSLIASFYVFPATEGERLIAAADAQHAGFAVAHTGILGSSPPLGTDPFWDFVFTNSRELEEFPYSGSVLVDLELVVPGALESNHPVGNRLSDTGDSTFITYAPADAAIAIGRLSGADLFEANIVARLRAEGRDDDYPELVGAIQDSARRVIDWLRSVSDDEFGLLSIG